MAEKTVPWWRRAISYALDGIRSGFGLFPRAARPDPEDDESFEEEQPAFHSEPQQEQPENEIIREPLKEEIVLPQKPVQPEPAATSQVAPEESVPVVELAADAVPQSEPVNEQSPEPLIEPVLDPVIEAPAIETATIEAEPIEAPVFEAAAQNEPEPEPVAEPELVEPAEPIAEAAAEPEPIESIEPVEEASSTPEVEVPEPPAELATEAVLEGVDKRTLYQEPQPDSEPETEPIVIEPDTAVFVEDISLEVESEPSVEFPVGSELVHDPIAEPIAKPIEEARSLTMPEEPEETATDAEVVLSEHTPAATPDEPLAAPEVAETATQSPEPFEDVAEPVGETVTERPAIDSILESTADLEPEPQLETEDESANPVTKTDGQPVETVPESEPESPAEPAEQAIPLPEPAAPLPIAEATEAEPTFEAAPAAEVVPEPVAEAAQTPEPALGPAPLPAPAAAPEPVVDEKAAAKLAARQKKLDEADAESPISVIVDKVYDGPLDLLLDLIRKQDIDIYDIPIAKITAQFLAYVNQLKASDVDVAGEFIYTASLLIHIKSKMLLPRAPSGPDDTPEDPRRELVERLLEHERFKNAAQMLQQKQMLEAASWTNPGAKEFKDDLGTEPEIAADTVDLVRIFRDILERVRTRPVIDVTEDSVTVGQMIQFLARRLTMEDKPVALRRLLSHTRSERALIAMFLALLELVRLQAILLRQDRQFSEIFIKKHTGFDSVMNEGLANARDDWK